MPCNCVFRQDLTFSCQAPCFLLTLQVQSDPSCWFVSLCCWLFSNFCSSKRNSLYLNWKYRILYMVSKPVYCYFEQRTKTDTFSFSKGFGFCKATVENNYFFLFCFANVLLVSLHLQTSFNLLWFKVGLSCQTSFTLF